MSGIGNLPTDMAGTQTLTWESKPRALSAHPALCKTEETEDPPQVVPVGVQHGEAPSLQARSQHLSCGHGGNSDGDRGSEEEEASRRRGSRKAFREGTCQGHLSTHVLKAPRLQI